MDQNIKKNQAGSANHFDDEIDLFDVISTLLFHRTKFIVAGLIGLLSGLTYSLLQPVDYEQKFIVSFITPMFNENVAINAPSIARWLNDSRLNGGVRPSLSFNKKTNTFTLLASENDSTELVKARFREAVATNIEHYKSLALSSEGLEGHQVILNSSNNISWRNKDIGKADTAALLDQLEISFGAAKKISPNPTKFCSLGLILGLVFGFLWMLGSITLLQLKTRPKQ